MVRGVSTHTVELHTIISIIITTLQDYSFSVHIFVKKSYLVVEIIRFRFLL